MKCLIFLCLIFLCYLNKNEDFYSYSTASCVAPREWQSVAFDTLILQENVDNVFDLIKHDFCMFYGGIRPENLQICLIKSLRLNKDFAFVFSCGINDKRLGQLVVLSPNAPMQLKGRVEFKECDLKSNLIFVFYKDIDRQLNCEVEDNDFVIESMVCGEDKLMVYLPFKNE